MKTLLVLFFFTAISMQGQTMYGYSTSSSLMFEELVQSSNGTSIALDSGKIKADAVVGNPFKRWQLKMGFSTNNQEEYSIAVGFKLPVFKRNLFMFEANFFTFPALSALFGYQDINIANAVVLEPMIGIAYYPFYFYLGGFALCTSISSKYQITQHTNLIVEFRQIHTGLNQGSVPSFQEKDKYGISR